VNIDLSIILANFTQVNKPTSWSSSITWPSAAQQLDGPRNKTQTCQSPLDGSLGKSFGLGDHRRAKEAKPMMKSQNRHDRGLGHA
jgi:hypothetical protein